MAIGLVTVAPFVPLRPGRNGFVRRTSSATIVGVALGAAVSETARRHRRPR